MNTTPYILICIAEMLVSGALIIMSIMEYFKLKGEQKHCKEELCNVLHKDRLQLNYRMDLIEAQIRYLSNKGTCWNCGAPVEDGAIMCEACEEDD